MQNVVHWLRRKYHQGRQAGALEKLRCGTCPNCGDRRSIIAGPQGGASRNWYCTSCLHGWNVMGYLDGPNFGVQALGIINIELVAQYMVANKGRVP